MRSRLQDFELRAPHTLDEALHVLSAEPGQWRPFAGGTDLMVLIDAGKLPPAKYLSLWRLRELHGITVNEDAIVLGALTTYSEVLRSRVLQVECPLLCRAAAETGGVATQNRGTIGGNIANASPAADSPPALLAYDAELELISQRGTRRVPYDRFHTGYKQMDLAPDELIRAVHLPRRSGSRRQFYRKVGTRRAQAISKVCIAGVIELEGTFTRARIALGSIAPTVVRARHAEAAITGKPPGRDTIEAARTAVLSDISPIDDIRSTARYRATVAANLLEELLTSVT